MRGRAADGVLAVCTHKARSSEGCPAQSEVTCASFPSAPQIDVPEVDVAAAYRVELRYYPIQVPAAACCSLLQVSHVFKPVTPFPARLPLALADTRCPLHVHLPFHAAVPSWLSPASL